MNEIIDPSNQYAHPSILQEQMDKVAQLQELQDSGADQIDIFMAEQELAATQAKLESAPEIDPPGIYEHMSPVLNDDSSDEMVVVESSDKTIISSPKIYDIPSVKTSIAFQGQVSSNRLPENYKSALDAAKELSETSLIEEVTDTHGIPLQKLSDQSDSPDYRSLVAQALHGEIQTEDIPKPANEAQRKLARLAIQDIADIEIANDNDLTNKFHEVQVALLKVDKN